MKSLKNVQTPKNVVTKTKINSFTSVRFSILLMTAVAMVGTGIIAGSLILTALPAKVKQSAPALIAPASANDSQANQVLVWFKDNIKTDARVAAIKKALEKPVNCIATRTYTEKKWFKTTVKTASYYTPCKVGVVRLEKVISPAANVNAKYPERAKRADVKLATTAAKSLNSVYLLTTTGNKPDLDLLVSHFRGISGIQKAEKNPNLSIAGSAATPTNVAALASIKAVNVSSAQANVYGVDGDADDNGKVEWQDVGYIENNIFHGGPAIKHITNIDYNKNGSADVSDLTILTRKLMQGKQSFADVNNDGVVDQADYNYLNNYISKNGPAPSPLEKADYNGDGKVNIVDTIMLGIYLEEKGSLPTCLKGDANGDGVVNRLDVYYLNDFVVKSGPAPLSLLCADMDEDLGVDLTDLLLLIKIQNSGSTIEPQVRAATFSDPAAIVDEPIQAPDQPLPGFLVGDVNSDNQVNLIDAEFLSNYVNKNGTAPNPLDRGDMNSDGKVDGVDVWSLYELVNPADDYSARAALTDANKDGTVNIADATYIANYVINDGPAPDVAIADLNGNLKVDFGDSVMLTQYLDRSTAPALVGSVVTTPDNTSFFLGDINGDGVLNFNDPSYLIKYLYYKGAAPSPIVRADVNQNILVDLLDYGALIKALNVGGIISGDLTGDINGDHKVDVNDLDALWLLIVSGGSSTVCDVNKDGRCDALDAFALTKYLKLDTTGKSLPDLNGDGKINLSDVDFLVAYLYKHGSAPADLQAADINGDGKVNLLDVSVIINSLKAVGVSDYLAGDVTKDGIITDADITFLIEYLYGHAPDFVKGSAPDPLARGDVNKDGLINLKDVSALILRLYPIDTSSSGGDQIIIGVLDTGYKKLGSGKVTASSIMNLNSKFNTYGWNALTGGSTEDINGHGTKVIDLLKYIAPKADILPVTILNQKGVGNCVSAAKGINYAVNQGVDIINISASGKGSCTLLKDAVNYAQANGAVVVMAAGNDSSNVVNVQSGTNALIVGAADKGVPTKYTNAADIFAPQYALDGSKGTSYSAAYVTGSIGLLFAKPNSLNVNQIQSVTLEKAAKYNNGVKVIDAGKLTK